MLRRHPVLAFATFGYLAVVAFVTLGPQPVGPSGERVLFRIIRFFGSHDLTQWITYSRVEFLANVAMFVPIGLLFVLVLGRQRWWLACCIGVVLTLAIEFSQLGIPGRVSDPRDVLANSLGALIGVVLALLITAPAARREAREARERFAAERAAEVRAARTRPIPISR